MKLLEQFYYERLYGGGMPEFKDLVENDKKSIEDTIGFRKFKLEFLIKKAQNHILQMFSQN